SFDPGQVAVFVLLFICGVAIAYSFLLMLSSVSVWMVRNQSMMEMWWLLTSLMRYPREIFSPDWAMPIGWFFSFIVPIMLAVSMPASEMVKVLAPQMVLFTTAAALGFLFVSRRVFKYALGKYRSASS